MSGGYDHLPDIVLGGSRDGSISSHVGCDKGLLMNYICTCAGPRHVPVTYVAAVSGLRWQRHTSIESERLC